MKQKPRVGTEGVSRGFCLANNRTVTSRSVETGLVTMRLAELVSARLSDRSAACAVAVGRLLRVNDSCRGAIRHRLIGMRNYGHNRHSGGKSERKGEDYHYLFHDRVPSSMVVDFARTGKELRDSHHVLELFGQSQPERKKAAPLAVLSH
jgi:hypothetical protein